MSPNPRFALLPSRGVIAASGPQVRELLQGLITNDVERVSEARAIYSALLTPQGKLLYDFFLIEVGGALLIDCSKEQLPGLFKKLKMYRLRAEVSLEDVSEKWDVVAAFDGQADGAIPSGGVMFADPRLARLGGRIICPANSFKNANATEADYNVWRLAHGVPDILADAGEDATFMLEANFEELNGVDFKKGCYIGQELAARMKHRGRLRKRLLPVNVTGDLPPFGTPIKAGGRAVGTMCTGIGARAIALLRVDRLKEEAGTPLRADAATLEVDWPDWIENE